MGRPGNPHDTRLKELFRNKGAFVSLLKDMTARASKVSVCNGRGEVRFYGIRK